MLAYHFLRDDMTSGDDPRPWTVGEERTIKGELVLCRRGYHYSPTARDALEDAQGPVLCLVDVDEDGPQDYGCTLGRKGVSRRRKLLAAANVERELRLFACECAERALLRAREQGREPDPRSWRAIEVARRYAEGQANDKGLVEAWLAVWTADWIVVRDTVWATVRITAWVVALSQPTDADKQAELDWQRQRLAELVGDKLGVNDADRDDN